MRDDDDPKLYHEKGKYFFEYIKLAHDLCRDRITEECSYEVMETLEINDDVIDDCVFNTFENTVEDDQLVS